MIPIGTDGFETVYLEPRHLRTHLQCTGVSQSGKSRLIEHICVQLFTQRKAFALLDPHGKLYDRVVRRLALLAPFRANEVKLFDASAPNPHGFDPFHFAGNDEEMHTRARLLTVLTLQLWGVEKTVDKPRFNNWLFNVFHTMMELNLSISQVLSLLRYDAPVPGGSMSAEWEDLRAMTRREFQMFVEPLRSRFRSFDHPRLRRILGRDTLDFPATLRDGGVLLANLRESNVLGEEENRILAALFLGTCWHAALREQREIFVIVDEFQLFATDRVASMLDQAAKFKLHLMLFHQREGQTGANLRDALGNASAVLRFTGERTFEFDGREVTAPHVPDLADNPSLDAMAERFIAERTPPPPQPEVAVPVPPQPEPKLPGRGGDAHKQMQETVRGIAAHKGFRAKVEKDNIDVALEGHGTTIAVQVSVSNSAEYEANAAAAALGRYDHAAVVTLSPAKAKKLESLGIKVVDYAGLAKFLSSFAAEKEWLTTAEFAKLRGYHVVTVRRWCKNGLMPCEQHGREYRISLKEVEAWTPPEKPKVSTQKVKPPKKKRKRGDDPDGFYEIMGLE